MNLDPRPSVYHPSPFLKANQLSLQFPRRLLYQRPSTPSIPPLHHNHPCLAQSRWKRSQNTTEPSEFVALSPQDVADVFTNSDCWVIVDNKVYDVTDFIPVSCPWRVLPCARLTITFAHRHTQEGPGCCSTLPAAMRRPPHDHFTPLHVSPPHYPRTNTSASSITTASKRLKNPDALPDRHRQQQQTCAGTDHAA